MIEAIQVFHSYDTKNEVTPQFFQYCPRCARELVTKNHDGKDRWTCPGCGFIHYLNPLPCVSVLVVEGGLLLLGKRASGNYNPERWCLPCGYMEYDEDFLTAAIREVKEETGLAVRIESILSVVSNFHTPALHSLVIVLLARVVGGALRPGDDIEELMWVSLSGPFPELAFEADKHIILRYAKNRFSGVPVDPEYAENGDKKG